VASYDKAILPGGEGKIKIQVQTSGREGLLEKTASIYSNDPGQPTATIRVKAQIKPVIILTPTHLQLSAQKGAPVSGEVEIKANIDKPLILKPGLFNLAERLTYTLVELEKGKKYVVRFKRAHGLTEPLQGYLYLETNYPEKPEVTIFIQCNLIQPNSKVRP
jgi:hypothetical protein